MIRYYFETKDSNPVKYVVPDEGFKGRPVGSIMVCVNTTVKPDFIEYTGEDRGIGIRVLDYDDLPNEIKAWLSILGVSI